MECILSKDLEKSILQKALSGNMLKQLPNDSSVEEYLINVNKVKEDLIKKKIIKKDIMLPEISEEMMIFEIPDSWKWVYLGEIFQHNSGKALNSSNQKGKKYSYITTSNLYWNKFELNNIKEMLFTEEELPKYTITKGDLLVCEGGDVGRSAIWPYEYETRFQNHIHRLRPYLELEVKYYYYVLYFYKNIGKIGGKGIGIKGLSSNALHSLVVPLPPLEEQKRIVKKIEQILPLVYEYQKDEIEYKHIIEKFPLEYRRSVVQSAMQGKLTMQIESDMNIDSYLEQIFFHKKEKISKKENYNKKSTKKIDDILFEIPDSWRWVRFGDIVDFRLGKTPERTDSKSWGNKYHWFSISDMISDSYVKDTKEYMSQYGLDNSFNGYLSPKGTLIMSFKLTVGRVSILDVDAVHNEAIISIFPFYDKDDILRDYLFKILPYITKYGDTKSAIKGNTLNSTSLNDLLIPLPPLEEQKRITDKLNMILPLCGDLEQL